MKTKNFLASCAKATFALATVVMMNAVFTSCSKDDDETFTNTVTLDTKEMSIVRAEYKNKGAGNYEVYLSLSDDGQENVRLELNKDLHTTNTPIKLTQKEEKHTKGEWYWAVMYRLAHGYGLINANGNPHYPGTPVFKTGTLTAMGDPAAGTISIKLENGFVAGNDKKDYTLTVSYSGPITKKQ